MIVAADKKSKHERRLEMSGAEYIWEKDIKERIAAAMNAATSEDDFYSNQLQTHGLTISRRGKSKKAASGEYVIYQLMDKSKMPSDDLDQKKDVKAISYRLGSDYEPEHLREILTSKQNQQQEQVQQPITEKTPKNPPMNPVPADVIEHIPTAKISEETPQRKSTIKSATTAAKSQTMAPDKTAHSSDFDDSAIYKTMIDAPRRRKRDEKIRFEDTTKEITAVAAERKKLTQAKKSFEAELERDKHDQRRRAILREIEDLEFDDPMDDDDQPDWK